MKDMSWSKIILMGFGCGLIASEFGVPVGLGIYCILFAIFVLRNV